MTCLRCVLSTRHEYGADSSSEAAANDGMEARTASAFGASTADSSGGRSGEAAAEISTDIFSCLGSPSACSRFAMSFTKTGSQALFEFRLNKPDSADYWAGGEITLECDYP